VTRNFKIGITSFGLQSMMLRIKKLTVRNSQNFIESIETHYMRTKCSEILRLPVERASKTMPQIEFSKSSSKISKR
jgi:hypothetical protein